MKEILINVSKETRMVDLNKSVIGNDGENLQGKLVFTFIDEFVNGQARLEYEIKGNKNYVVLDKENNTYTIPVKNVITKEGQIDMQLVITEGTNEEEIPVFKSNKFYLFCNSSINAVNEAPDGYELWIEKANAKLNEVDNVDIDIQDNVVTITKKDGTVKSKNVKGEKGEKGDPGVIKMIFLASKEDLPEIGSGDTLYFVKVENPTETNYYQEYAWVNKGTEEEPNWDWEYLGGAVLNVNLTDYVKKTDIATGTTPGLCTIAYNKWSSGLNINNQGMINISMAENNQIDDRSSKYQPIVPANLEYAVGSVKASETQFGTIRAWKSTNEDGEVGLNISTEV